MEELCLKMRNLRRLSKDLKLSLFLFDKLNCGCKALFGIFKRACQFVGKHYYLFFAGGFITVARFIISGAVRYFLLETINESLQNEIETLNKSNLVTQKGLVIWRNTAITLIVSSAVAIPVVLLITR